MYTDHMRQVTLELPDEVVRRAERLAALAHRNVSEVLADAVTTALPPLDIVLGESKPVSQLSDDEVKRLSNMHLDSALDKRLTELLDRQQRATLNEEERVELLSLKQTYEANLLLQAEALSEAVKRGLREPLLP